MSLGHFGGRAPSALRTAAGGSAPSGDVMEDGLPRTTTPSTQGDPASSEQVMPGVQAISHNLVFSSTDSNTVAWAAGTIMQADGVSRSIDAGNTGNMSALTYIYLDLDTSATVLQTTTTYSSAVGNRKILIAVAENVADAAKFAKFFIFGGNGGLGGTWITADMIIAGTITANEITVTQLSALSANLGSITAGTIVLSASGHIRAGQTDYDTGTGFFLGISGGDPKFSIGNSAGRKLTWDGSVLSVDGVLIAASGSSIGSAALNLADRGWIQTCAFSVTDLNTVGWGAGSFIAADGTTYSIDAGNTGNMAARSYIYLDIAVSTTAYQVTTTASAAVGAGKVMIGTAINGTDEAEFELFVAGPGGSNINASQIVAGSITANEIAASTITAGKLTVSQLSAIAADLGAITAGTIVLPSGGFIRSGQTAYNTGTGFYLGNDSSVTKFSIGNAGTNSLTWDGTTLTIRGTLNASDISAGTLSVDRINANTITANKIVGSGVAFQAIDVFTTAGGTWTRPTGVDKVWVRAWAGGGGGGGGAWSNGTTQNNGAGGGGGSSEYREGALTVTGNVTVAVGSGGAGGAGSTSNVAGDTGTAGGDTTFGALMTAKGGSGGVGGQSGNPGAGGSGGAAGTGGSGGTMIHAEAGTAGQSGGDFDVREGYGGNGGTSFGFAGGAGGAGNITTPENGADGYGYGSGGGGGACFGTRAGGPANGGTGGAGSDGLCIVAY